MIDLANFKLHLIKSYKLNYSWWWKIYCWTKLRYFNQHSHYLCPL